MREQMLSRAQVSGVWMWFVLMLRDGEGEKKSGTKCVKKGAKMGKKCDRESKWRSEKCGTSAKKGPETGLNCEREAKKAERKEEMEADKRAVQMLRGLSRRKSTERGLKGSGRACLEGQSDQVRGSGGIYHLLHIIYCVYLFNTFKMRVRDNFHIC